MASSLPACCWAFTRDTTISPVLAGLDTAILGDSAPASPPSGEQWFLLLWLHLSLTVATGCGATAGSSGLPHLDSCLCLLFLGPELGQPQNFLGRAKSQVP